MVCLVPRFSHLCVLLVMAYLTWLRKHSAPSAPESKKAVVCLMEKICGVSFAQA